MGPKAIWTPLPRNSRPRASPLARMKRRSNLRGSVHNRLYVLKRYADHPRRCGCNASGKDADSVRKAHSSWTIFKAQTRKVLIRDGRDVSYASGLTEREYRKNADHVTGPKDLMTDN